MCGVVGMVARAGQVAPEALAAATAALEHRGPDGLHRWVAEHRRVGLGHAWLSVMDRATGAQPIANAAGTRRLVVNGELYGHQQDRRLLEQRGHRFHTRSDSEVALHLYEEFGQACLSRLRGEFALLLWDETAQTLLAARDRLGAKPLYYAQHNGQLLLASEVKALFAAGMPARWDLEAFRTYACGGMLLPDRTFFHGVRQLPPGHYLLATPTSTQVLRYWDWTFPRADAPAAITDDAEATARFRAHLADSVQVRMQAEEPVGLYLSGGLDSSSVAVLAVQTTGQRPTSFTLAFEHAAYDESARARAVAAHLGLPHVVVPVTQSDLADHFAPAITHCETVILNGHGIAKYLLSRQVRQSGVKAVLTGEGADEVLAGYEHFRWDLAPAGLPTLLERWDLASDHPTAAAFTAVARRLGFVPTWLQVDLTAGEALGNLLTAEARQGYTAEAALDAWFAGLDGLAGLTGRHPLHQSMYLWAHSSLPNYILSVLGDRTEMAHGVEGRLPFLDHPLVEFLAQEPVSALIRGSTAKYILRQAVADILPPAITQQPKHPLTAPPLSLLGSARCQELLQDTLRRPGGLPFYDQARVIALLDRSRYLPQTEAGHLDALLMSLLSTALLQDCFHLTL